MECILAMDGHDLFTVKIDIKDEKVFESLDAETFNDKLLQFTTINALNEPELPMFKMLFISAFMSYYFPEAPKEGSLKDAMTQFALFEKDPEFNEKVEKFIMEHFTLTPKP